MNQYNCPNCGAPIQAEKCPYCGTVFSRDDNFDSISKAVCCGPLTPRKEGGSEEALFGRFTSAGIEFETAATAMHNLSQAIGMGALKLNDARKKLMEEKE